MYVSVEIEFPSRVGPDDRIKFWQAFELEDHRPLTPDTAMPAKAINYENQFKAAFPGNLQNLVNEGMRDAWEARKPSTAPTAQQSTETTANAPKIGIRLVAVEYGSIKPILDIIGIENSDIRDFVLMTLSIYAPPAFNLALSSNVHTVARASVLGNVPAGSAGTTLVGQASDAASRMWMIANGTLILPVVLALLVVYFWQAALLQERNELSKRAETLTAERKNVVDALTSQNQGLSSSNLDLAKKAREDGKGMQDALISILKDKVVAPPTTK